MTARTPPGEPPLVRAGGGIVLRHDEEGHLEVLLVHRPRYRDWSFPKGKTDPGESDAEAALREVAEETGWECRLGAEAGETRYIDARNRDKLVRYWYMEPLRDHGFTPNDEIDERRWASPVDAAELISYPHDRRLLHEAVETLPRR